MSFLNLSQTNILDSSILNKSANVNSKFDENGFKVLPKGRKTEGKGEIAQN